MEKLNREFYDEYTRLDNLCRQMFNSDRGVSDYIEAMKNTPHGKAVKVKDWDSDLKMLKHYRHIRNYLAHTAGAFHQEVCLPYDITWVKGFYSRIMKQKDPLSLLFSTSSGRSVKGKKRGNTKKKKTKNTGTWLVGLLFVIAVIVIWLIFKG